MSTPQPMCPHGASGLVFGKLMDVLNRGAHAYALKRLSVSETDRIVEIGFGTGQLAGMLAKAARHGFVTGVDPSELMVETARARNAKYIKRGTLDLRLGTAAALPWPDADFDKAAALHSFQFWSDPLHDLAEVARVLRPGGLLVLILRAHDGSRPVDWLPNPLSRGQDEVAATIGALARTGFAAARAEGTVGSSPVVTARRAA